MNKVNRLKDEMRSQSDFASMSLHTAHPGSIQCGLSGTHTGSAENPAETHRDRRVAAGFRRILGYIEAPGQIIRRTVARPVADPGFEPCGVVLACF